MAQWQVPLLAEFLTESCSSFPFTTLKLAVRRGLALKLVDLQGREDDLRSGEKADPVTVETPAAHRPAAVRPEGIQSKERDAGGFHSNEDASHVRCAKLWLVTAARVQRGRHQNHAAGMDSHGKSELADGRGLRQLKRGLGVQAHL